MNTRKNFHGMDKSIMDFVDFDTGLSSRNRKKSGLNSLGLGQAKDEMLAGFDRFEAALDEYVPEFRKLVTTDLVQASRDNVSKLEVALGKGFKTITEDGKVSKRRLSSDIKFMERET